MLVAQETLAYEKRRPLASLQLSQKVVMVESVDFFDVTEDHVTLTPESLRDVFARQLWDVVLLERRQIRCQNQHKTK